MHLEASWRVVGVVTERRELKSAKNEKWRGYVVKVATLGLTVEVNVSPEQHAKIGEGEHLELTGRFESGQDRMRLVCDRFAKPAGAKAVGA